MLNAVEIGAGFWKWIAKHSCSGGAACPEVQNRLLVLLREAYNEGHDDGYSEGYSDCRSDS